MLQFLSFFFHFLKLSFIFFHFLSFSFIFFQIFSNCLSFSFISFHFLSFPFIFLYFLSFSFSFSFYFSGAQNLIFVGLNFVTIFLDSSYVKNQFFGPVSGGTPFEPSFSCFFLLFFPSFSQLSTRVRPPPAMGSWVGGSNSIPETVLAQEGARQNVLNPKPQTLKP